MRQPFSPIFAIQEAGKEPTKTRRCRRRSKRAKMARGMLTPGKYGTWIFFRMEREESPYKSSRRVVKGGKREPEETRERREKGTNDDDDDDDDERGRQQRQKQQRQRQRQWQRRQQQHKLQRQKKKEKKRKKRKKKKEVRDSRRVRLALRTTRSLGGSLDVIVLVALAHPMVPKRTNKREVGLSEW